jgi:phosphoglycolate phosphatase
MSRAVGSRPKYKAVLFDVDGVLIDSWETVWRCYLGAMQAIGGKSVSKERWRKYWGLSLEEIPILRGLDVNEYARAFRKLRSNYDKIYTKKVPCSERLIKKLRNSGIKVALVTMEMRTEAKEVLRKFPFEYDVLVTGSDVHRGRPWPDAILLACKKLKVLPSECLYVGDSSFDLRSAKAAGCDFCGVLTGAANKKDFKNEGVKLILSSVCELEGIFR